MRTNNRFPCLLPGRGWGTGWFLIWGEGRAVSRTGLEGWLRWFAHPLGGAVCRGHVQYPAFAPGSSKVAVGGFGLFWSRICPNYTWMQLFLVPYSFFVFCCWRRGVSRCKYCSKGFQVCLNITANFNQILLQILINRFFMIWHLGCLQVKAFGMPCRAVPFCAKSLQLCLTLLRSHGL